MTISKLEWFLRDDVTPKSVMAVITGIHLIVKYFKIENSCVIMCHNISIIY